MAQHDYDIANQTFPSFRSDLNSVLEAINTSNSGTSRPSSAVAGTIWLDTTSATTPTLKFYDGADDISLATLDYSANTVNWIDSTVVFDIVNDTTPQLGGDLDVNGNSLVSTSNGNITFTPDGTGKVVISGLNYPTSDGTADQVLKTDGSGNLSFVDAFSGISWQSVQTTGFTAVAGNSYPCNTTSAGFTVTLPATPSVGDQVQLVDYAGTFDTNNLTINPNGNNINGQGSNVLAIKDREAITLTYIDSTQGWLPSSGYQEGTEGLSTPYSFDALVIAGGGSGGGAGDLGGNGGGGGAGGYRTSTQSVSIGTVITVTVGDGGASPSTNSNVGNQGSSSSISGSGLTTITSAGGGGGAGSPTNTGTSGGSGGGAGQTSSASGASGNVPSTSPSQGNDGGDGFGGGPNYGAGGGGGAGAVGGNGTSTVGGSGGNGTASSITGSSVTRAGGGGGGVYNGGTGGSGGSGGGGNATQNSNGSAGTVNTGGGGGGGAWNPGSSYVTGGAGGKGVVILSVLTANYSGTTTGSPTVTTSGSNTIMQFNGSGSYTG